MEENTQNKEQRLERQGNAGVYVPAGIFIGMGIGFLTDHLVAGLFIGLGAGLAAMAIVSSLK